MKREGEQRLHRTVRDEEPAVSVDDADPFRVYGGLQDNAAWVAPSEYPGGITNHQWENMYNGDGFWMFTDPADPDYIYCEYQGGTVGRVNRYTHEARNIQPAPNYKEKLRWNWNTPIALSPNDKGTIYIGAQNAVDGSGTIVGRGDIAAQTEQVLKNIEICLDTCGAGPEHLIQWSIYITQGQPIGEAFGVFQRWWGGRPNPPANTVLFVSGFMPPDFLLAIEAIAVIPQ